jgi:endonuclease/exonuclease/phosphatase family metal-dependent hydrolase
MMTNRLRAITIGVILTGDMKLTLTSLNLQAFEDWDARLPHILDYLGQTKADILLLEEVVYLPTISPFTPAHLLNHALNYPYESIDVTRLQEGTVYPIYREGLATLSHIHIVKSESIILQKSEDDAVNRIVQLIDFRQGDAIIKLAHVHFSITDFVDYATPHLKETLELLKSRGEKRIIMGDFNLTYLEDSQELWGDDYRSTCDTPYVTYPLWKDGPKRVDYALVPKEYTIESVTTSPDGLSDHRALTVVISIPETI